MSNFSKQEILHKLENMFDDAQRDAFSIASLGDLLQKTDAENLQDYTINHLGIVLEKASASLLETCHRGLQMIKEAASNE
jgi:hypothetical protein